MSRLILTVFMALLLAGHALAVCSVIPRSSTVLRQFQHQHPCPATGLTTGACPGWVKDHKWPLCAGGTDTLDNLVWSPVEEAKLKDVWEKAMCRRLGCTHRGE